MQKILVADDEPDLRHLLVDELTYAGFRVKSVSNGADAVVAAVEENFDLVLLDMMMPQMDGIHTIRVLRKVKPHLPILGLTGHVGRGYMAEAAAYGVICLGKPIDIPDLLKEIDDVLTSVRF